MCFTMLSLIINTRLVTSAMVLDGLVLMVSGFSSYFVLSSFSPHFSLLRYWRCYLFEFLRICSSYVNGTFIFSETVVIIGPMNGIFGYIIVSFGVYCTGVSLISILFFSGKFCWSEIVAWLRSTIVNGFTFHIDE